MKHLVLGASLKPIRASHTAIEKLVARGEDVVAVGLKEGTVAGVNIQTGQPHFDDVDTVLLYLNPQRQEDFKEYIFSLHPKRVIFNPGTENMEFAAELQGKGVEATIACSLVLMATGQY